MQTPKTTNPTLTASVEAERLYRAALEKGDETRAATILEVARLFVPALRFGPVQARPETLETTEQPGRTTDLSEDEAWRYYTEQTDGTAARREQEARHREEDEDLRAYYRQNPESAPTDWDPVRGYDGP
jgi:hypothetical protein